MLAVSSCATSILATLLAYAASSGDLLLGGMLLLMYMLGYVVLLLFVVMVMDGLKFVMVLWEKSAWVNSTSGFLFVVGGTYAFFLWVVLYVIGMMI